MNGIHQTTCYNNKSDFFDDFFTSRLSTSAGVGNIIDVGVVVVVIVVVVAFVVVVVVVDNAAPATVVGVTVVGVTVGVVDVVDVVAVVVNGVAVVAAAAFVAVAVLIATFDTVVGLEYSTATKHKTIVTTRSMRMNTSSCRRTFQLLFERIELALHRSKNNNDNDRNESVRSSFVSRWLVTGFDAFMIDLTLRFTTLASICVLRRRATRS
jgi:hypothetical protein